MVAHIHEKIDFTAEVFVVYKDTVLLKLCIAWVAPLAMHATIRI